MVGAIVLYILALATGTAGLLWFCWATSDTGAVKALMLCGIAAVCLSGALIIDGIRFYCGRLSVQLGYLLKPGSALAHPGAPSAAAPIATPATDTQRPALPPRVKSYHVIGRDQATGRDTEVVVTAIDETDALRAGEKRGLEVKRVAPSV